MKNSTVKFLLLVSLALNIAILATIGYHYRQRSTTWVSPFGHELTGGKFLFEELALKPGQAQEMRNLAIPFRAGIDRQRQEIALRKRELIGLMRAANPDQRDIDALIATINAQQEKMQHQVVAHMLAIKKRLNSEQQGKFIDLIDTAMTRRGARQCAAIE